MWAKSEPKGEPTVSQVWARTEPSVSQEWAKSEPGVSQEWAKSVKSARWAMWANRAKN